MRFRLTPRDTSFYDMLAEQAQHLVTGSRLLSELLGASKSERKALGKQISEVEHNSDDVTHAIMRKLASTFVTPLDRDDLAGLTSALDDCMDFMEEAADLIVLYKLDELPAKVSDQIAILQRCSELTAEAMPLLVDMGNLEDYWVEINRLENQADKAHRKLLAQMFDDVTDPIQLMKLKEVVETLEAAADAFETVANMVETIALKES